MLQFALAIFLLAPEAQAFRLDPMVLHVPITKPQASFLYTVENNTKAKVAVQFEVRGRKVDINGKEERPEVEGFLVYPEQMALEPGEKRNVRVSWMAEAMPKEELAFRFVASQLPIDFSGQPKGSARSVSLKFLVEYVASLYLDPPRTRPNLKVKRHSATDREIEILVANEGSAHQLLERMEITLQSGGRSIQPSLEIMKDLRTENLLPGGERLLRLPMPKGFSPKDLKVSVNFNP